jgi:hypothetical protein
MRSLPIRFLVLLILLLSVACAGERHALKLSNISPQLKDFEGSPYDALVTEPVHYTVIGEPEYDRFFQEAAAVYGSLLFAMRAVDRAQAIVDGKAKATPMDFAIMITVIRDTLPTTQKRAIFLYNESIRLREKVGTDFAWKFYKIPKVRGAVNEARDNLESTKKLVPELMTRIRDLSGKIQWNKMLEKSL